MTTESEQHPTTDQLAAYAAGTLSGDERAALAAHAAGCGQCRHNLAEWSAVGLATRAALPEVMPDHRVLAGVHQQIALERAPAGAGAAFLWQLLLAQVPLVRGQIWAASALVLSLGAVVTALLSASGGGSVLALLAPVVAAAGVGFIYGPENDPPLELELATPTSPRLILLARLTIVFGYNFLLAVALSAVLAGRDPAPGQLQALILQWLGPMLLLSAASLALSLRFGSAVGVSLSILLWALRLVLLLNALAPDALLGPPLALFGSTNIITLAVAAALVVGAVAWLPRQEPLA
jgi:hypothetical protein